MTAFAFTVLVPAQEIQSSALGVDANGKFQAHADIGKPVKLAAGSKHVLCSTGDEIAGFVNSVEPFTVNAGLSFGGVLKGGRIEVIVAADQGATPMAVGDYVVAGTQLALGTSGVTEWNSGGTPPSTPQGPTGRVKTGTPTKKLWQCIRIISGTGVAGDTVLIERD